ncbi:MAG: sulfotransferase [Rhodocyclales bacterium]|nr:sulfotransferase [Rhodocyclales bacterium]
MSACDFPGVDQLLERAAAATGLSDFGDGWREGLEALVDSIRQDVPVDPSNVQQLCGPLLSLLTSRLHSERGWSQRRDCLKQAIRAPLVVTGLPRTGTTALHKLLSMDPQFQGLEQWLIGTPMPRPPRESWAGNPHFRAAVEMQQAFLAAVPALRVSHEVNADEVDECLNLLAQSFVSHYPATAFGLPSYDRWWWGRDETASYRRYADNLRLIGADAPGQRWLLKNPGHIAHLDALLTAFPDACIVQTHRDPAKSIPSVCSVIWPARCFFHAREVAAAAVGSREFEFWAWSVERAQQVRGRQPDRFVDVRIEEFQREPMQVVRRIYSRFGLELSAAAEERMMRWTASNPRHKHGQHEYGLQQFGLSEGAIHERFAAYMERHGLIPTK